MVGRSTVEVLKKFRDVMKNSKYVKENLQAYIIPSVDAHQSEYIAPCDKRVAFISGFTGSRGTAVITDEHAALWTDGRYFLQANQQLDENWTLMKERIEGTPTIGDWLNEVLTGSSKIGFDPYLLDNATRKTLKTTLQSNNNSLVPVEQNLVDVVWENKPNLPSNEVEYLPIKYTGKTFEDKVFMVREEMSKEKVSVLVITALDEVAWLFNLRGSDIDFNPVFYSYAVITQDVVYLFIEIEKLTETAKNNLMNLKLLNLQILPYKAIKDTLQEISNTKQGKVWVSRKSSYAIVSLIPKKNRLLKTTPVEVLKSIKNETEIAGARNAHIKDGAALCELFYWLSNEISTGKVTEISAANKLESIKKNYEDFLGLSFDTISASGPNAAVIHYKPTKETNRKINPSDIYLLDCGSQYSDGTTDVTRTWHFTEPTPFQKKCYTLVLKGHIALSSTVFPNKCTGHRIDSFARKFLWEAGLDYLHGTGHGVGSYLNVHEGPIAISSNYNYDDPGIQDGMILSIEPGFYKEGEFGVRLENLALVKEAKFSHSSQGEKFLTFELLTLVPFQLKMIDQSLLTPGEITWINNYHLMCREKIGKCLEEGSKTNVLQWLIDATESL